MTNFLRQTDKAPGVDTSLCLQRWKEYSLDKLNQEEEKIQTLYFACRGSAAMENQARVILETLRKYIRVRYEKEDNKNQKKINL